MVDVNREVKYCENSKKYYYYLLFFFGGGGVRMDVNEGLKFL